MEMVKQKPRFKMVINFVFVLCIIIIIIICRLDVGDGKEINLDKCPRSTLQRQCIKYLGPVSYLWANPMFGFTESLEPISYIYLMLLFIFAEWKGRIWSNCWEGKAGVPTGREGSGYWWEIQVDICAEHHKGPVCGAKAEGCLSAFKLSCWWCNHRSWQISGPPRCSWGTELTIHLKLHYCGTYKTGLVFSCKRTDPKETFIVTFDSNVIFFLRSWNWKLNKTCTILFLEANLLMELLFYNNAGYLAIQWSLPSNRRELQRIHKLSWGAQCGPHQCKGQGFGPQEKIMCH